jgi:hypothetical protein
VTLLCHVRKKPRLIINIGMAAVGKEEVTSQ